MNKRSNHPDEQLARLSEYLDGGLEGAMLADVEQALARDAALRAELAKLRRVDELVRASAPAAPEIDWTRFTREARRARESAVMLSPASAWRRWGVPLAAAAVLAMAVTAGVLWSSLQRDAGDTQATEPMVAISIDRGAAERPAAPPAVGLLVQVSHAAENAGAMGPPLPRRSLVVSVVGRAVTDSDPGTVREDEGYF